jgi:hypothetical protein
MRKTRAFCPNCKQQTVEADGLELKCSACGFEYHLDSGFSRPTGTVLGILVMIFKGVAYTVLGIAALVGLALAIAFVGCLVGR